MAALTAMEGFQAFRLFDLPQELQDMIFDRAYPLEPRFKVLCKDDWDKEEAERKKKNRAAFIARTFPPFKVEEWLVSKRFFLAAASTWFKAQMFTSPYAYNPRYTTSCAFLVDTNGLYCTFATQVMVQLLGNFIDQTVQRLLFCRNLKTVILSVEESFLDLGERYGWEDHLTDDELNGILHDTGLAALRGLKMLRITLMFGNSYPWKYASTTRQRETFKANLVKLESMAAQSACRPLEGSTFEHITIPHLKKRLEKYENGYEFTFYAGTYRPLYLGSAVWPMTLEQVRSMHEEDKKKSLKEVDVIKTELAKALEEQAVVSAALDREIALQRWMKVGIWMILAIMLGLWLVRE